MTLTRTANFKLLLAFRQRFLMAACAIAALLLPGLPHLAWAQQFSVGQPRWDQGDRWTWHRSSGADITFTVLRASSDGYSVHVRDSSSGLSVRAFPLNISPENSHFLDFRWPLEPGKKWTNKVSGQLEGRPMNWTVTRTVAGQESVEVPAGTFEAVRISGQHCNDAGGGCGDFVVWYAPKAKYAVKITWTGIPYWPPDFRGASQQLISYEVRTP